jgi:glycosyltransferase involved in cell wall biosynthesis
MTARAFNLVFLTSAPGWRGSGVSFAKIAHGLADRGHRVHVVTRAAAVSEAFMADGLAVTQLQLRNTGIREVVRLRRVLARHRAHAIMADTPRDLRLSVLSGLLSRRRVVYRYNMTYRKPPTDFGDRLYARRVSATVYLSEFIERDAEAAGARYGGRSFRIPNGFDTKIFAPDEHLAAAFRGRFGLERGELVVMTAGKLVKGKRLDRGIDALARVRMNGRPVTYILCGDGPEEPELKNRAEQMGLRLLITGMIDQASLRGAYNAADVVLHTGRETFGNVVGEAMSCGRTVACVREGAAPEVVGADEAAGVLLPPDDLNAMASTLTALLNDPDRRTMIGAEARRRIERVFPLQQMISGYESMFAVIIAGR